jgi:hypothetical protein
VSEVDTMTTDGEAFLAEVVLDELAHLAPRSPMRAMTLTSALVLLAIMPSRVDLPTPEPANMPMRWPLPRGRRPSSDLTPDDMRVLMRCAGQGVGRAGHGRIIA